VIQALTVAVLLGVGFAGAAPQAGASTASGLRFLECVTGKLPVGRSPRVPRPGGCKPTRTAVLDAEGSGLDHIQSLVASPDGRSLYAVSSREDSVAVFRAKPLGLQQCFSGDAGLRRHGRQPCKLLPHAGAPDDVTGFNGVWFVTTSPDGGSVYTLSADDHSIGIFARNRRTGNLSYKGCITGGTGANSAGQHRVCTPIPSATRTFDGAGSGLGGPGSLTVSPDSRFVYVAATTDAAIATFARAPDGSLSFRGCITGGSAFASGPAPGCTVLGSQIENPHWSGLRDVSRIVLSPDGRSLYASSPKTASVTEFQRDPSTGTLTYQGCITGEFGRGTGPNDPCVPIPTSIDAGFDSGMWLINQLAISRDGRSLYGLAVGDDAIDSFSRDPTTGALAYTGCISGDSLLAEPPETYPCTRLHAAQPQGVGSGLAEPAGLAISPNGHSVFVAARRDSAIARLSRDPAGGALAFSGCLTASHAAAGPCTLAHGRGGAHQLGFAGLGSLAIAGKGLYADAQAQSAISRFAMLGR
jgi:hypothetical protein